MILTQDNYRLWARIGPSVSNTPGDVVVTPSNAEVAAQLALLDEGSGQMQNPY
jgi:hypothetical protein